MARRIDRFTVRPATPADSASILACLESAFEPYRDRYTAQAFLDTVLTPATLAERFASMAVFVAVDSADQVVGTIAGRVRRPGRGICAGWRSAPGGRAPEWHGSSCPQWSATSERRVAPASPLARWSVSKPPGASTRRTGTGSPARANRANRHTG
jgi:hypothetical protein